MEGNEKGTETIKKNTEKSEIETAPKDAVRSLLGLFILITILIFSSSHWFASTFNEIWFDQPTLHFLFSSIFQGFAAMLSILVVGMIFYVDKLSERYKEVKKNMEDSIVRILLHNEYNEFMKKGEITFNKLENFFKNKLKTLPGQKPILMNIIVDVKELNYIKNTSKNQKFFMFFNLYSIIAVMVISALAMPQCSWILIKSGYWNLFSVHLINGYSLFAIFGLGVTLRYILNRDFN